MSTCMSADNVSFSSIFLDYYYFAVLPRDVRPLIIQKKGKKIVQKTHIL